MKDRGISFLEARAGTSPEERDSIGRSHHFLMTGCLRSVGHYGRGDLEHTRSLPLTRYALKFCIKHAAVVEAEKSPLNDLIETTRFPSDSFWAKWQWVLEEKGSLQGTPTTNR